MFLADRSEFWRDQVPMYALRRNMDSKKKKGKRNAAPRVRSAKRNIKRRK